jgi:hypothetical protein
LGSIPEMGDFFSQQDVIDIFTHSISGEHLQEALFESDFENSVDRR